MAPNLTLKYQHSIPLPSDLSSALFTATQIPHVRCIVSGKFVIITLATQDAVSEHTNQRNSEKLAELGLNLVESPEAKCARTILAFRPPRLLLESDLKELAEEISEKNNVEVISVNRLTSKTPILKVTLATQQDADKLLKQGIRAYYIIVPTHQLEMEKYKPVNQCMKCYKFDHYTSNCKSTTQICSKCASTNHTHLTCNSTVLKCLNCQGEHVAVSFSCPAKKNAQKAQTPFNKPTSHPPPPSNPTLSPSAGSTYAATTSRNIPHPTNTNTQSPPTPLLPDANIAAKVHACSQAAAQMAGQDNAKYAILFPAFLEHNNLPSISFPPIALELAAKPSPPIVVIAPPTTITTTLTNPQTTPPSPNTPAQQTSSAPAATSTPNKPTIDQTIIPVTSSPVPHVLPPPSPTSQGSETENNSVSPEAEDEATPESSTQEDSTPRGSEAETDSASDSAGAGESGNEQGSSPHSSAPRRSSPSPPPSPQHTPVSLKTRSKAHHS